MTEQFVVFDTEYASWKGFIDLPPDDKRRQKAEIVQIAALKVNLNDLNVAEEFNCYVKPCFEPKLTEYFTNLTGITDELLAAEGTDFLTAYGRFLHFAGNLPCYSHAWGQKAADETVIRNNLQLWQFPYAKEPDYRNIAPWFAQRYKELGLPVAKQSSGQIGKLLGLDKEIAHLNLDEHNALYDVYSILLGLRKLKFSTLF